MKKIIIAATFFFSLTAYAQEDTTTEQEMIWENDTIMAMLDLPEIMVKGERPIVRVNNGKLTYDMPRLLEGRVVSNIYESILQLPGVREQDGNLTLTGTNSLMVVLDSKPTTMSSEQLMELLQNTPHERLQTAEVMYSAPPQFHARGAVINLVLRKNNSLIPNLQGQVNATYRQGHYAGYSTGATLLYSTNRLSADLMYSLSENKNRSGMELFSNHKLGGTTHYIEQYNAGSRKSMTHNTRLGLDYDLTGKDKLSFTYTTQLTPKKDNMETSTGTFSNSESHNNNVSPAHMHNVSLQYTSGFGLSAGADYTYYNDKSVQNFSDEGIKSFITHSNQKINRLATYADQSHTLNSWTLNYGAKFSYASNDGNQSYETISGGDLSYLNTRDIQKEYTYNIYAGFSKPVTEKLSVSASLAGEYYTYTGFKEWALFPTFEATYLFSPSHIVQLSVSSDRNYPSYWESLGSVGYLNGYVEIHGNKDLRPSKEYTTNLNYIIKGKYIISLFNTYSDDYSAQLPYQSPDRLALIYKTINWDYKSTTGVNATIPFKIGEWLGSKVTLTGFYDRAKCGDFFETSFYKDNWVFYTGIDNSITLSSNIQAELTGAYITPNIQGPMVIGRLWSVGAGVKWTFANKKAELRLKASDMFNSWSDYSIKNRYGNQDVLMNVLPYSREVSLSFTYKFGNYNSKERKDVDTSRFGM